MKSNSLNNLIESTKTWFTALSPREQGLIAGTLLVISLFIVYMIAQPILARFEEQATAMETLERHVDLFPNLAQQYARLKLRRDQIEDKYEKVDTSQGGLSYLEGLIQSKAGVSQGFKIEDKATTKFGSRFEQTPYTIKFFTSDFAKLVEFLKALVEGANPLILSRVDMKKSLSGDRIEVEIDASRVSRAKES